MASAGADAAATGNLDVRLRRLEEVLGVQVQSRAMAPRMRELEELSFGQVSAGALIPRVEQLEIATFGSAAVSDQPTVAAGSDQPLVAGTTAAAPSPQDKPKAEVQPSAVGEAAPATLALCADSDPGLPAQHARVQALAGKTHAGSKGIEHFREFDFGSVCSVDASFLFVTWERTGKITQIPMDKWRSWCKLADGDTIRPSCGQSEPEGEPSTDTVPFPLGIDPFKVGDECQGKDVRGEWWSVRIAKQHGDNTVDVLVHDGYNSVWPSLHRLNLKAHDNESFREFQEEAACSGLLDEFNIPLALGNGEGAAEATASEPAAQVEVPETGRRGGRVSQGGRGSRGSRGGNGEGNGKRSSTQKSTKLSAAELSQDAAQLLAVKCESSVQPSSCSVAETAGAVEAACVSSAAAVAPAAAMAKRELSAPTGVKAESDDEAPGSGTRWHYSPCNNKAMSIRVGPSMASEKHKVEAVKPLYPGDEFRVVEEIGPDDQGITFLKLRDGRGWVFDVSPSIGVMCTRSTPRTASKKKNRNRQIKTVGLALKNVPAGEKSRWSTLVPVKLEKSQRLRLRLRGVQLPPTSATAAAKRLLALNTNKSGGCTIFHSWRRKLGEMIETMADGHVRHRSLALLETMDEHFAAKTGGTWRPFVICVLRLLGTSRDDILATCQRHSVIEEAISLAEELTDARLAGVHTAGAVAELQGRSFTALFVPRGGAAGRGSQGGGRGGESGRGRGSRRRVSDADEDSPSGKGREKRQDCRELAAPEPTSGGVPLGVKCPAGHFMKDLGIQDDDWECDLCHVLPKNERSFSCMLCGYDLCPSCHSAQPKERHGYTLKEVGKHASRSSCWVVLAGRVLDVTHWLAGHPGGDLALLAFAGRDATEEFKMLHSMSVLNTHSPELHPDLGPLLPDTLDSGPAASAATAQTDAKAALFAD